VYDHKTIRRRRAVLGLLVVCSIVLLTASFGGGGGAVGSVQNGVFQIVSPIQDGASRALKPFRDLFGWFGDTFHAKGENSDLRHDVDKLRAKNARLADQALQNTQFRRMLGLDKQVGLDALDPVTARVTGTAPTVFLQTITINKGAGDGIRKDQAVIAGSAPDGALAGKVTAVLGGYSVVTLLTDSEFGVQAKTDTGVTGTIEAAQGNPRELILSHTTSQDEVTKGQMVMTRGTDPRAARFPSLFPPDVPIGTVTSVDDAGTDAQRVHVRPFVNPRRIDFVQVITKTAPPASS
jgi:rod shape-determining protein MreC